MNEIILAVWFIAGMVRIGWGLVYSMDEGAKSWNSAASKELAVILIFGIGLALIGSLFI